MKAPHWVVLICAGCGRRMKWRDMKRHTKHTRERGTP